MPRLSRKWTVPLRWIAFVLTVLLVSFAGLFGATFLLDTSHRSGFEGGGDRWLAQPPLTLGLGAAVYLGSRVAPSIRLWSIALAAVPLLLLLLHTFISYPEERVLAWGGVAGVAVGSLAAWWRIRSRTLPAARLAPGKSPRYRGTAPFQHADVDRRTFFGREREIRSLLSLVLAERLVILFGKSGMGKSSLLNAGLVDPLLERGYFPMTIRLADRTRGLVGGLLDGVGAAARAAGVEIVAGGESDLWEYFRQAEFWSPGNDLLHPVLILDQFEELFTLHSRESRHAFIAQLAELLRGRDATGRTLSPALSAMSLGAHPLKLKIVLALREDYLADLEDLSRDIPGILQHRFRLGALTTERAREAIVEPARIDDTAFETAPFTYKGEALERILTFLANRRRGDQTVAGQEIEPVQLQLVCQYVEELVRTRLARGEARVEVTEADLGGESQLQRVLESFYERTLASVGSPRERRRIQRLCERRLISTAGRRLTEAEEEIERKEDLSKDTLRHLVDTRLLRPEPRLGGVFYELSHDSLVEPIRQSRRKRMARRRRVVIWTSGLLALYLIPWWAFTGRREYARQQARQAMALAAAGLADRDDPNQVLESPRARLTLIAVQFRGAVRTREGFGAMMFAAEDVGRRYPELFEDASRLRREISDEFNRVFALTPPSADEDNQRNRRVRLQGGRFQMGDSSPENGSHGPSWPQHPVDLAAFTIQEHEVTNGEYRRFAPAHDRDAPANEPVTNVNWFDAMAYAAWLGGSLPTEAEWEFAARGNEGRTYPWGDAEPTCDRGKFGGCGYYGAGEVKTGSESGKTPDGVYDLAGSLKEWCRDLVGEYPGHLVTDPLGPSTGSERVVRGGSFNDQRTTLRGSARESQYVLSRGDTRFGFRVAWR